MYRKANNLQ